MELKQKPNGIYFLDVRLPNKEGQLERKRVSLDTRDRAEALAQKNDWLAGRHPKHPAMGGVIAPKGRTVCGDVSTSRKAPPTGMTLSKWLLHCEDTLWKDAKGRKSVQSNVRILRSVIESDLLLADVSDVTIVLVEKALRERYDYAEGTVKKLMGALSAALGHATKQVDLSTGVKYLTAKPSFPTYTVRNIQERVLSVVEEAAVFECIAARREAEPTRPWWLYGALLTVLLDTGFRLSEALSCGPSSINLKRWRDPATGEIIEGTYIALSRYETKTDKPREVPATSRVLALLPLLNAQAIKGRWFPWKKGGSGAWYLWNNIREDMEKRGFDLSDVKQHTFRHTCGTRLAIGGMDLLGIRDWLGHADISITAARYIHLMTSHLYRGAAILDLASGSNSSSATIEYPLVGTSTMPDYPTSGNNRDTTGTVLVH